MCHLLFQPEKYIVLAWAEKIMTLCIAGPSSLTKGPLDSESGSNPPFGTKY